MSWMQVGLSAGLGAVLMGNAMGAQTVAAQVEPSRTMDAMVSAAEKEEVGLAEAMPADRYSFVPTAAEFKTLKPNFEKVKPFGATVVHMAQGNYFYGMTAGGTKPPLDLEALDKVTDKDAAVKALKDSFVYLHQVAGSLTTANAFEHVGRSPEGTRIGMLAGGIAHSRDHYGQLVEYLRMNGIVPPASRGH